jgi:PIN domain
MKPSVYIETSVVSYLTARSSADQLKAACQQVTQTWWNTRRNDVEAYISPYVVEEASRGDSAAAQARMETLTSLPILPNDPAIIELAQYLLQGGGLPAKARLDALHIACATFHRMDVLLTWNCTHIANPMQLPVIRGLCSAKGYRMPELVTPFEMMEAPE